MWGQPTWGAGADTALGQVRVGVMLDVSERKRAELALLHNSELWKLALECTGDGVWDWYVQEGREVLSPQCKALYGFAPDELPDTPEGLDSRTHPDDLPAMRAARDAHFAGRTPTYTNEHRVQCKDGRWKWILSRGMVLERDSLGHPLRMIGTHTDITGRKQADALRIERDLAAAADRAKSAFLSRVSHELRTPLNAVLGFSQLLELEPGDGERQRRWVAQVLSSGRHLLALLDDVLDISSAQTGQLPMTVETLPLQPLAAEVVAMLSGAAKAAGVHLHDDTGHLPGLTVRADRKRLLQVLSNLLSNAIKYNRPGGWVRLKAEAGDGDGGVVLSVADSGPGLDAAQRARLFQPFERVGAQHGAVPGTGLGLALSRQLVEAMGGRVTVDSAPGRGSTFRVHLPAA
jgi:PAS domain S-box-containing protein